MTYGFLIIGSIFAYYAWKVNGINPKQNSDSIASGKFVDDVPINPEILGIQEEDGKGLILAIKDSVSQIIEPFTDRIK
jgi:hypothetical protein